MKFPPDYPYSPPSIRFMTKVWHPNVYEVSEYIRELSIPRTLSLPVSTLSSHTCACPPRIPCVPFPFIRFSLSLSFSHPALTPLSPRPRRPSLYNDRPALSARPSASLYLPPSAAIAFTTISFYIVTFNACETTRAVRTPGRRFHRDATTDGRKEKKRK